jgi:hypothetical protein
MSSPSQKAQEMGHVVSFLRASGIAATPTPLPDGRGPDFLVATDEGDVGIEVTELHREEARSRIGRRQMEGIREQVLAGAKKSWDNSSGVPLEVHVHFNEHHTPYKDEIRCVVAALVMFVQANIPALGGYVHFRRDEPEATGLPTEVHAISIIRLPTHTRSYWLGPDSEWEATLSPEQLQAKIASKNQKVARYHFSVNVLWLLLVLDSRRPSGWFDLDSAALDAVYDSLFARTFVFDRFSATIHELKTRLPGSHPAA